MIKLRAWSSLVIVQLIIGLQLAASGAVEEPLGRNYRKNFNNYPVNSHTNNGKILSTSETKISSVSFKPNSNGKFSSLDNTNLKTSASEKEEEKFSIGLGVLSPSYSQKFGEDGKTKLDFNSDKGGFSYSLTNVVHPQSNSPSAATGQSSSASAPIATNTLNKVQSEGFVPSSYYNPTPQPNPQVNIYHKQTADPSSQAIYGRLSNNANNYPIPPTQASPYGGIAPSNPLTAAAPAPSAEHHQVNPAAALGNPLASSPFGYNPYGAAAAPNPYGQAPFNTVLSDAEKSFLQTVPTNNGGLYGGGNPYGPQASIGTHQHTLPQAPSLQSAAAASSPLPLHHQQQQQLSAQQAITQPKLVAQQQLTANPNSGNIIHNANYGPYSNPYGAAAAGPLNPYESLANPLAGGPNPYGGLNMAASQQYPTHHHQSQFGNPMEQLAAGNGMNYDFLNEFLY